VFGKAGGFASSIQLAGLNGTNGFRLDGIDPAHGHGGFSVASPGDLNGDGVDDILVGSPDLEYGTVSVVFGSTSGFGASISLDDLDGTDGFNTAGAYGGHLGHSVAAAGDVNGDGYADFIVGQTDEDPASYVIFGKSGSFDSSLEVSDLDGTSGFRIGAAAAAGNGRAVSSAGDVNGDGYDDLIIGAPYADDDAQDAGGAYVLFGHGTFSSAIDVSTLEGMNGFRIDGTSGDGEYDNAGVSVSSAGDINGDGYDDLMVGAPSGGDSMSGVTYVLYGRAWDGAVDYQGGSGNDSLTGSTAAEQFVGGAGNDTMTGGGGADAFRGGQGNDVIIVADDEFLRVDGGTGTDVLKAGAGVDFDFSILRTEAVRDIEAIDLSVAGANVLTLSGPDVAQLSDSSNELVVNGTSADTLVFNDVWTLDHAAGGYEYYTRGDATVQVAIAIDVQLPT
jgi:hypothetical protein